MVISVAITVGVIAVCGGFGGGAEPLTEEVNRQAADLAAVKSELTTLKTVIQENAQVARSFKNQIQKNVTDNAQGIDNLSNKIIKTNDGLNSEMAKINTNIGRLTRNTNELKQEFAEFKRAIFSQMT